jgi:predicted secreted hydrolase
MSHAAPARPTPSRPTPCRAVSPFAGIMRTRACRTMLPTLMLIAAGCDGGSGAPAGATLDIADLLGGADTVHARATAPRVFAFPRDHGPHPSYRTEWWYFTGNLTADDGRELGYQLTFFRSALTDSASFAASSDELRSPWRTRHAYMAHLAVTDAGAGDFHAAESFARGAMGLAGAEAAPLRVWLNAWSAASVSSVTFPLRLHAATEDIAIDLILDSGKPVVLQGDRGLSRKGAEPGNASYYYSLTRIPTRGSIRSGSDTFDAIGTSWLDREWSTSVLSPDVAGWDWLALQLSDSTELMMYRLRRTDGSVDPFSAATFVEADGSAHGVAADAFTMTPTATWRSADGIAYPVGWHIVVPALGLLLDIATPVAHQELELSVRYWEGMVRARGTRNGAGVTARGYLEMTGYGAADEAAR